uniref:Retrotransposon protein, putative, Ty3-gypsy subclass n=1 Tax=Oryza sativa subsp. japonica TaxID=39947 RepID=Q2R3J2_ORYSJ|nr:retrotransposon protein, putative, Ty3-gypsy subclass [Oryza sativa Japonica Group]
MDEIEENCQSLESVGFPSQGRSDRRSRWLATPYHRKACRCCDRACRLVKKVANRRSGGIHLGVSGYGGGIN